MFQKLKSIILTFYSSNSGLTDEFSRINLKRAQLASICCIFLEVLSIMILLLSNEKNIIWKQKQMLTSASMAVFMFIMLIPISIRLKNFKPGIFPMLVPYIGFCSVMFFCLIGSANDQLVSGSITPYVMSCLVLSVLLLIRPLFSMMLYAASFISYTIVVAPFSLSDSIRITNMTNAFSMTVVGAFISVLFWHYNRTNALQKYQIHLQQRLLENSNNELHRMAYYDPLTDLPNRRYLNDILQKESALMLRKEHESCLIMLDIDYFKNVNDLHGHPAGDRLLVDIGHLLAQNIRKYDTLCRLGGEEFIILLPQTTLEEAVDVADKLRKAVSSQTFRCDHSSVRITASIGVSRLVKDADATLIEQYAHADKALYLAKNEGRNCVRVVD